MNIIIVSRKHGRSTVLSSWMLLPMLLLVVMMFAGVGYTGYQFIEGKTSEFVDPTMVLEWQQRLELQSEELVKTRIYTEEQLNALRVRIAGLQSRLTRLDALGERLVDVANLDEGEFDFSLPPAVGGPEMDYGYASTAPDFLTIIDELAAQIENREQQLRVLNSLLGDRKIQSETFIAGRPIKKGWLSSRYGYRSDPFNGKMTWHDGIDFAGASGSDIISVAAGVVTYAADRGAYGYLVEINHGNGYVTRYAHCKEILVAVGDVVKKNDVIALMGSTGRSTGPHVHFEVLENGKSVDPTKYINRVARF